MASGAEATTARRRGQVRPGRLQRRRTHAVSGLRSDGGGGHHCNLLSTTNCDVAFQHRHIAHLAICDRLLAELGDAARIPRLTRSGDRSAGVVKFITNRMGNQIDDGQRFCVDVYRRGHYFKSTLTSAAAGDICLPASPSAVGRIVGLRKKGDNPLMLGPLSSRLPKNSSRALSAEETSAQPDFVPFQ